MKTEKFSLTTDAQGHIVGLPQLEPNVDYLHFNPVKHGLVKTVRDWPYSSFHRFVVKNVYPADWGGLEIDGNGHDDYGE